MPGKAPTTVVVTLLNLLSDLPPPPPSSSSLLLSELPSSTLCPLPASSPDDGLGGDGSARIAWSVKESREGSTYGSRVVWMSRPEGIMERRGWNGGMSCVFSLRRGGVSLGLGEMADGG